ncbi:MAG: hypothetical protein GF308_02490 [Candidatus Heimdallarchaeota archaeon]|nr:hypothetical protein [Candidatus Heimdallarchaeota archaeon]
MKTLITFRTKMGKSAESAKIIASILREKYTLEVEVVDLKENEKDIDLDTYQVVIIGSGIRMGKWYRRARKFLQKNDFSGKKTFVYVCSMGIIDAQEKNKQREYQQKRKQYLQDVLEKNPTVKPLSTVVFGGRKKPKKEQKRENWKPEPVEKWAEEIGKKIKEEEIKS